MRVHEASIPATPPYPGLVKKRVPPELDFHERLVALRKERGLTQQALAELMRIRTIELAAQSARMKESARFTRETRNKLTELNK